jgi:3-oxoadipate enol-lactonase
MSALRLHHNITGPADAPVIVFINGIFQDSSAWSLAVAALSDRYRCLTWDCRGQGQSDKPAEGPYTLAQHAADLAGLLDQLGIARAHVAGLSMGGMVSMHLARDFPERIDKLILIDTFAYLDGVQQAMMRSWREALLAGGSALRFYISLPWSWSAGFLEQNLDALLALKSRAEQLPAYASIHLIDGAITHDARPWLPAIRHNTLIIHGDLDRMAPPHSVAVLQQHLPTARMHWLHGAGHAATLEQPDAFHNALISFLDA